MPQPCGQLAIMLVLLASDLSVARNDDEKGQRLCLSLLDFGKRSNQFLQRNHACQAAKRPRMTLSTANLLSHSWPLCWLTGMVFRSPNLFPNHQSPGFEDQIMMEPAEIDVLKAFLHPEAVMFEFGSGHGREHSTSLWHLQ